MSSVLVVDDHDLIAQGLTYALRREGFEAHVCYEPDVELVLALAKVHRPVLALLDLQFGGGPEAGMALIAPLSELMTVLVITGVSDPAVLGACLDAGASGVASKSELFDQLLERIRTALGGGPFHSLRELEDLLGAYGSRRAAEVARFATFDSLTRREREVLDYLASGMSADAIAEQAFISVPTVRTHIQAILHKLGVNSQLAAVARVRETGWCLQRGDGQSDKSGDALINGRRDFGPPRPEMRTQRGRTVADR